MPWGGAGIDGTRPGRGGITRGRGDAFLALSGETEGDASALEAKKLPPGRASSTTWERLGVGRLAPDVDPVRAGNAGSAGDVGSGEAAWRRRLAPRHRDVVRRFFSNGNAPRRSGREEDGR